MNSVNLVGRLSRAPLVRFEGDGREVTTFTLQIQEPGRDGTAYTLYVNCVAWGKTAEAAGTLEAETPVAVEGKLCWRKHVDKHGQDKSALAVMARSVTMTRGCRGHHDITETELSHVCHTWPQ